jgi:hypothetical protein
MNHGGMDHSAMQTADTEVSVATAVSVQASFVAVFPPVFPSIQERDHIRRKKR